MTDTAIWAKGRTGVQKMYEVLLQIASVAFAAIAALSMLFILFVLLHVACRIIWDLIQDWRYTKQ